MWSISSFLGNIRRRQSQTTQTKCLEHVYQLCYELKKNMWKNNWTNCILHAICVSCFGLLYLSFPMHAKWRRHDMACYSHNIGPWLLEDQNKHDAWFIKPWYIRNYICRNDMPFISLSSILFVCLFFDPVMFALVQWLKITTREGISVLMQYFQYHMEL